MICYYGFGFSAATYGDARVFDRFGVAAVVGVLLQAPAGVVPCSLPGVEVDVSTLGSGQDTFGRSEE